MLCKFILWRPKNSLYLCYVHWTLINSLVCWFCMSALGLVLFQISDICVRCCYSVTPGAVMCAFIRARAQLTNSSKHQLTSSIVVWDVTIEICLLLTDFDLLALAVESVVSRTVIQLLTCNLVTCFESVIRPEVTGWVWMWLTGLKAPANELTSTRLIGLNTPRTN